MNGKFLQIYAWKGGRAGWESEGPWGGQQEQPWSRQMAADDVQLSFSTFCSRFQYFVSFEMHRSVAMNLCHGATFMSKYITPGSRDPDESIAAIDCSPQMISCCSSGARQRKYFKQSSVVRLHTDRKIPSVNPGTVFFPFRNYFGTDNFPSVQVVILMKFERNISDSFPLYLIFAIPL